VIFIGFKEELEGNNSKIVPLATTKESQEILGTFEKKLRGKFQNY
jgi:hypothetical protein